MVPVHREMALGLWFRNADDCDYSRMIQRYAIARKKDKCKIKGPPLANATVNRDLAALKHMLHKVEIWGYVEISPGRRVENLRDDGSVRTDYYTEEQLRRLISTAAETRGAHPLNFNDWPEFIVLDANTGLPCKEMLFLEFSDIDWNAGVLHVRNKTQVGFRPNGRKERRIPLNVPATYRSDQCFRRNMRRANTSFTGQMACRGSRYWNRSDRC